MSCLEMGGREYKAEALLREADVSILLSGRLPFLESLARRARREVPSPPHYPRLAPFPAARYTATPPPRVTNKTPRYFPSRSTTERQQPTCLRPRLAPKVPPPQPFRTPSRARRQVQKARGFPPKATQKNKPPPGSQAR